MVDGFLHVTVKGDGNCGVAAILVGRLSQQMHRPSAATSGEFAVDLQQKVKAARLLMAETLRARMGPENVLLAPATEQHKMLFENEAMQLGGNLNICFTFRLNHAHISIATAATSSRAAATSSQRGGGGGQKKKGGQNTKG
jgi:hypothetical protein